MPHSDHTDTSLRSGRHVLIYTRGACPTIAGGWAASLRRMDGAKELRVRRLEGFVAAFTTVNEMDLKAAISAIQRVKKNDPEPIVVRSNSGYLIDNANRHLPGWKERGWRRRDGSTIQHADLWMELDEAAIGRTILWETCDATDPYLVEVANIARAAAASTL